jgi:dUTP pyrophosphatase
MKIKISKISPEVKIPTYAKNGDAGMDLYAFEELILKPGERQVVGTGVKMEIPDGYAGLIWDKSGLAVKNGLKVIAGVVDCGYRGEIKVGLINLGKENFEIKRHAKIAQILIQKIENAELIEVEVLSKSERGESGFGSTGLT